MEYLHESNVYLLIAYHVISVRHHANTVGPSALSNMEYLYDVVVRNHSNTDGVINTICNALILIV